jgi:hypothetical protein
MAWWDDIRDMLKQELGSRPPSGNDALAAPKPLRQAQALLQQTARELADARARADVVRRRLGRAQLKLEALTRAPQPHPRYRERLIELARAIARDSDLAGSFQSHLAQLDLLHDQVNRQLRELDHDLSMARAASAIGQATQAVSALPKAPRGRGTPAAPAAPAGKNAGRKSAQKTTARAPVEKPAPKPARPATNADAAVAPGFRRARAGRVIDALQQLPQRRKRDTHED